MVDLGRSFSLSEVSSNHQMYSRRSVGEFGENRDKGGKRVKRRVGRPTGRGRRGHIVSEDSEAEGRLT